MRSSFVQSSSSSRSLAVLQCYNESVIMLEILCNVRESPTVRIAIILIASDDALRAGCY